MKYFYLLVLSVVFSPSFTTAMEAFLEEKPHFGCKPDSEKARLLIQVRENTRPNEAISASSLETNSGKVLPGPYPRVLTQGRKDCVIHAICSAIEYLTIPRNSQTQSTQLPLKPSRSGLYTLTLYHAYSNIETYKTDPTANLNDVGVGLGDTLICIDKYGIFTEESLILEDGFTIPGWGYNLFAHPIAPDMHLIATSADFDGINSDNEQKLLDGQIITKNELCKIPNFYSKVASKIIYEPIDAAMRKLPNFKDILENYFRSNKILVLGIMAYSEFLNPKKGLVQSDPNSNPVDFHAVVAFGIEDFNNHKDCVFIQNSWGSSWGNEGRGYLNWDYVLKSFQGGYAISLPGFFQR